LLGNDSETNETTAITKQLPARQWAGWKAVISARSEQATMDKTMSCVFYAVHAERLQAAQILQLSQLWDISQTVRT
jgi:hypothetical protein